MREQNEQLMAQYRANAGRAADGSVMPQVIVTTTGRRTGKLHSTPVNVIEDGGSLVIAGSKGGLPEHPQWYLNLQADPALTVEYLGDTYAATATVVPNGAERDRLYALMSGVIPGLYRYQDRCRDSRQIPVIRLERAADPPGE
jgi:deazaflavin-dependent oxidoreductase (nitroreductase family)